MSSTGQRQMPNAAEMWQPGAELPMAKLVLQTVEEQSRWSDKDAAGQPVTLAGLDSPAMRWLLRDRPLESRAGSGAAGNPPIVITPDVQDAGLVAAYRGQGLIWRSTPLWSGMQFLQWLPFHDVPRDREKIILWVRNDLFADARANTSP